MTIEKKPYKRIKLGRSVICLTPLDRAIIDCICSYVKRKGKVNKVYDIYKEVWRKIKPSIVVYHIKYCLLVMNHKQTIKMKDIKNKQNRHWRIEVEWLS